MTLSSLIVALSLPPPLPRNLLISSSMTSACPLPITLRLMVKLSEPIRNLRCIFTSFVPTTRWNGYNSCPPLNSTITPPPIAPQRCLHSPYFMAMNPVPIPLWERLSSLLSRNGYLNSMKPEKKLLLPMNPHENSWLPEQLAASTPGKLEIRSGLKPLISDYTTLLGNLPPKDMVCSKLFRYYLPSLTNSDFPPHGGYMMYSMPPSYLPIAPLNHIVPSSHHCLLMLSIMRKSMKLRPSSLTRAPIAKECIWPHGKDTPHWKTHGNPKLISVIPPFSWTLISLSPISGHGITPSWWSLHEYLLAAAPVSSFMIIYLSLFPPYYVVSVFVRIFFFFIHTYWLYLFTLISFSLPFFFAHTWNSLALCCHPQNTHPPPCHQRDPPFHEDSISHELVCLFHGITRTQCHLHSSERPLEDLHIPLCMSLAELPAHIPTALHLHGFRTFVSMLPPKTIYPTFHRLFLLFSQEEHDNYLEHLDHTTMPLPCLSPLTCPIPPPLSARLSLPTPSMTPSSPTTVVTILFPHRSTLLFIHSCRLLTWRGRHHSYINTSYLLIHTSSFCFLDLSMDIANS